jgi:hypothetical protein
MGIFGKYENESFEFPLKKTDVVVSMVDETGVTTLKQSYFNNSNRKVESFYTFPILYGSSVTDCVVEFEGGRIVCNIQEKQEAEKIYNEAISDGKKATILTQETGERYDMRVGNVSAFEAVTVTITYIVHTRKDYESGGEMFTLPTTFMPRYTGHLKKSDGTGVDISYIEPDEAPKVHVRMNIVSTNSPIHEVVLPKWNGTIMKKQVDGKVAKVETECIDVDKDFVVIVKKGKREEVDESYAWAEKVSGSDEAVVKISLDENKMFSLNREKKYEFIFVIDRSGSMGGTQMINARKALSTIINSLPVDCYFNIFSFGSHWERMFSKSVRYEKSSFEESKRKVEHMEANMGGTEIRAVLQTVYETEGIPEYERRIILLTDGGIWGMDELFSMVTKYGTPIFTIGVGNSVSHELVIGLAEKSGGNHEIIMDADLIEKKAMQQLYRSMYEPKNITVGGKEPIRLRPGQRHIFTVLPSSELSTKEDGKDIVPFMVVSDESSDTETFVPISWVPNMESHQTPMTCAWAEKEISKLQKEYEGSNEEEERSSLKNKMIEMSKKYHVLCQHTALVGVLEGHESDDKSSPKKIITPLAGDRMEKCYVDATFSAPSIYNCSNNTGSLIVSGGVGIAKNMFIGNTTPRNTIRRVKLQRDSPPRLRKDENDYDDEECDSFSFSDERPTMSLKESYKTVSFQRLADVFSRAIQFDGRINYATVEREFSDLPKNPGEKCTDDDWASMLFLAYIAKHNMNNDEKWKMMVEKTENYLHKLRLPENLFTSYYEKALQTF